MIKNSTRTCYWRAIALVGVICFATVQGFAQGVTVENYSGGTNAAVPTSTTLNNGWFGYKFGSNDNSGCNLATTACIDIGSNTATNGAITYTNNWRCVDGIPANSGGSSALYFDYNSATGGGTQNVYIGQELPSSDNGGSTIQMGVEWTCIPTAITNSGTIDDAVITGTGSSALSNLVNAGGGTMRYGLEGTGGQNGWPADDVGAPAPVGSTFQVAWYLPLRGSCDVIGTVNTAGTAVTKASGASFNTGWTSLHINGVDYAATINSTTSATLGSSAGTQTGVAYSGAASSIANAIVSNCIVLATYDRAGTLLGFGYKSTGGTPGVGCSGASSACQPTSFISGDLNGASTSAGHIQHANVVICSIGCTSSQFPILETPAPLWQQVLTPGRAIDWTQAGIPPNNGALPSAAWTQSGSTIAAYTGTTGTINTALGTCGGTSKYVLLGAGSYTLSGAINLPTAGNCELRLSSGANLTSSGTSPGSQCGLLNAFICLASSDTTSIPSPGSVYTWSAGFAQGSTQITLSSVASLVAGTILYLDQCDTGYTGAPCTGTSTDNGNLYNCEDIYSLTGPSGCSIDGGGGARPHRQQLELHTVVSVAGSVVTINPPIEAPNWASGQTPQVFFAQPIKNAGVNCLGNCIINTTSYTSGTGAVVEISKGENVWIQGISAINPPFANIGTYMSTNFTIQSNYIEGNRASAPSGYGIRRYASGNDLVANNIIHNLLNPIFNDGPEVGSVVIGNFAPNVLFPGQNFMNAAGTEHWTSLLNLWEHNILNQIQADDVHGTSYGITEYRNAMFGWQSVPSVPQNGNTNASSDFVYARYGNKIGNILGTPGYHNTYANNASATSIYYQGGATSTNTSVAIPADTLVKSTSLRFANFNSVTPGVVYCGNTRDTGFSSAPCSSTTEAANAAPSFPGMVATKGDTTAGQDVLPPSLFFTARPSWWANTIPFPAIGPDVSSGNVGECSQSSSSATGLNTVGQVNGSPSTSSGLCAGQSLWANAWGGHINAIPSMSCFLGLMGGAVDGSSGQLSFNFASCFSSGTQASPSTCSPGTGSYSSTQTPACTNPNGGTTVQCYTVNGTTPATDGTGTGCTTGTLLTSGSTVTISTTTTLNIIAGTSTLSDSSVNSYVYTITASSQDAIQGITFRGVVVR